jgi:predicted metal-dependent HD superfamily phosphohydrolase
MMIVEMAENHVKALFKTKLSQHFLYHNLAHTQQVVSGVKAIAIAQEFSAEDTEKIEVAAWFHDTGYVVSTQSHEDRSVKIVVAFLDSAGKSQDYIDEVSKIILATKFGYEPQNVLEEAIRDADFSHFANEDFSEITQLLRTEWEKTQNKRYTDLDWALENYSMLKNNHRYYTRYAKDFWKKPKSLNLDKLTMNIIAQGGIVPPKVEVDNKKKKGGKENKFDRGVDTLFRITLNNHTRLSNIADSKANILLSVNAIIISIALSSIIPKLDSASNAHLVIPTFVMLMFSVVSIIFAILSTRPKVTSGTFTQQDVADKKVNLLFFGNFYKMPYDEYETAMNVMMRDTDYLYNSMIKDLYFLGIVLERKYRLLRITYSVFMIGIIISVMAFIFAFYYYAV